MTLNIEVAFPMINPIETRICLNCNKRSIRVNGVALCEICAAHNEALKMNTPSGHAHTFNYIGQGIESCACGAVMWDNTKPLMIDESDPDVADYIEHNTFAGTGQTLNCRCRDKQHHAK